MSQYFINIGALPNDGTGDPLRTAFNDTNLNFDQIFAAGPVLSNVQIVGNKILTLNTNGNLVLSPNGVGRVVSNVSIVPNTSNTHDLGSPSLRWNTVYSNYVDYANLSVTGNLEVSGNVFAAGYYYSNGQPFVSGGVIQSNVAPASPTNNTLWWDEVSGRLYVWYTDVDGSQWVDAAPATGFGGGGGANLLSVTSSIIPAANVTYGLGNATNQWANLWVSGNTIYLGGVPLTTSGNTLSVNGAPVSGGGSNISNGTSNVNIVSSGGNVTVGVGGTGNVAVFATTGLVVTGITSATGNITGGNILTAGIVSATGNITSNYFIGNGSQLTGISAGSVDWANVTNKTGPNGPTVISLGRNAAAGANSVGIGTSAAGNNQGSNSVAIGTSAGSLSQQQHAVAIGPYAGFSQQGEDAVAIGWQSGQNDQTRYSVAIGWQAGQTSQDFYGIAIGRGAGQSYQGVSSVAIGEYAGYSGGSNAHTYVSGPYSAMVLDALTGVAVGQAVTGNNIVAGTKVDSIDQGNSSVSLSNSFSPGSPTAGDSFTFHGHQGANSVAVGTFAGQTDQGANAVALGAGAGTTVQSPNSTAVGFQAGYTSQGANSVAVGARAGYENQEFNSVAVGYRAGFTGQNQRAVAVGEDSGYSGQGEDAVAIGQRAGYINQGILAVAIGNTAGSFGQSQGAVAVGQAAGSNSQGYTAIAVGQSAGFFSQSQSAIALGVQAGNNTQGSNAVAMGTYAGYELQSQSAVAIGPQAGSYYQLGGAVAVGAGAAQGQPFSVTAYSGSGTTIRLYNAFTSGIKPGQIVLAPDSGVIPFGTFVTNISGEDVTISQSMTGALATNEGVTVYSPQGEAAAAIGFDAGSALQGQYAVALGYRAGYIWQGNNAVALGAFAGATSQGNNSIIINATGANLENSTANTFTVKPIRNANTGNVLFYDADSGEITYDTAGNANTGNVTFDDVNIIGDGNLYLQPDPANTSAYLDVYLTGGPDIHIAGNGENVIIGRDETANITVGAYGNVDIQTWNGSANIWTFGADGTLTFPGGNVLFVPDNFLGSSALVAAANTGVAMATSGDTGALGLIWARDIGNIGASDLAEVVVNGPGYPGNVVVITGNTASQTFNWTFDYSGNLTVPGNIVTGGSQGDITGANLISTNTVHFASANAYIQGNVGGIPSQLSINAVNGNTYSNQFQTGNSWQATVEDDTTGANPAYGSVGIDLSNISAPVINIVVAKDTDGVPLVTTFGETGTIKLPVVAFSSLPSAATIGAGAKAFVSDANLAAVGNFGQVISGSAGNTVPVFSDGSNWRIG